MHGADLDHMSHLLALEDTIPTASRHTSNVEEFGAINHVIIWVRPVSKTGLDSERTSQSRDRQSRRTFTPSDAYALGLDLETEASLILPQRCRHPRLHPRRGNLARRVELMLSLIALPYSAGRAHVRVGIWRACHHCWIKFSVVRREFNGQPPTWKRKVGRHLGRNTPGARVSD